MSAATSNNPPTSVPWLKSLRTILLLTNLLLALVFGAIAFILNQQSLQRPLAASHQALSQLQQQSVAAQLRAQTNNIEDFSQAFNALASSLWTQDRNFRRFGERLLTQIGKRSAIVAVGLWPEPLSFNPQRERYSFYWTLEDGRATFHGDYNDPANISYHGEPWYTPARWLTAPGCFWTERFIEPFLQRPVIACIAPIRIQSRYVGATSLVIDPARLQIELDTTGDLAPYFVLLDQGQGLLLGSGINTQSAANLPGLAQTDERFRSLSLTLYDHNQQLISQAKARTENWDGLLNQLVASTRQLSQLDAAAMLARVDAFNQGSEQPSPQLKDENQIQSIGGLGHLLTGHSAKTQIGGFGLPFWVSAATTAGAIFLALLLASLLGSRTLVSPLRRLLDQLRQPAEDTHLDDHASNEIGAIAKLINARHDRIRLLITSTRRQSPEKPSPMTSSDADTSQQPDAWAVVDALADAVILTDLEARITYLNSAAEALAGVSLAKAENASFDEIFAIYDRRGKQRIQELAAKAIKAGRKSERALQSTFKTRGGHSLPIALTSAPLLDAKGRIDGAVIVLRDNRQLGSSAAGTSIASRQDKLTASLNRQAFDAEFAARVDGVRVGGESAFSLLFMDVDHMQEINDTFGNDGGDEFLRQLAKLIQSDVSDENPVYRLYGDKFAVMLATDDDAEAQVTAELLRADVQSWGFQWKGEKRDVSLSIGLVRIDKDSGRAIDILRLAGELCQQAQAEGRGRIVSKLAQGKKNERRDDRGWLATIKQGLSEDRFHLSTQQIKPLQRKADEGLIFDTMMLLEDDEGFWTGAETFMPVAERNNLSVQLDRWMVTQVFKRLAEDPELQKNLDCCIISLSASTIQAGNFLDFMFEQFKEGHIPPAKVCLDLNEKDVHNRISAAKEFCQTMSRAGCRISLSKVTTRPSSFRLIKQLPVDFVRFDPVLTRQADSDPVDRLATESLHRIIHTLGRQGIATQVNSPELLRILQGIGIHYAQGDAVARHSPILFHAQS